MSGGKNDKQEEEKQTNERTAREKPDDETAQSFFCCCGAELGGRLLPVSAFVFSSARGIGISLLQSSPVFIVRPLGVSRPGGPPCLTDLNTVIASNRRDEMLKRL